MRRLVPAMIALLVGACAAAVDPPRPVADAAAPPALAPMVPDDGPGPTEKPQCERSEIVWLADVMVIVTLPCRPFDPRTDLGYPLP